MNDQKDPQDPSSTSLEHDLMAPKWDKVDTLLGGTEAMRAAGLKYLPRHQDETDLGYEARRVGNVLLNRTEHTLENLVGKPFSEPIKLDDKLPDAIKALLEDIDLQGNSLDVFCRQWFLEGMAKAFCHVLVDFPIKDSSVQTQDDQRKAGLRPYWCLIQPENVLAARSEMIQGVETLVHVRIMESYTEPVGFVDVPRRRIRVLEPGTVTLYKPELDKDGKEKRGQNGKAIWRQDGEPFASDLPFIPLLTFYAHRDGFMLGKPPIEDLADLNITHWQSNSEQRHILTVTRFPILACSGAGGPEEDDSDDITISPNKVLYVKNPQGKIYYVEHTGASIESGRKDLEQLEHQMADYGASFLRKKTGNQTATAAALDTAEADSALASIVKVFEGSVEHALWITAQWLKLGEDFDTCVELNTEWSGQEGDMSSSLDALQKARDKKEISRVTFLGVLKDWGLLPDDFDVEEDAKALDEERWRILTPQEIQQILAVAQAKQLSFSEVREVWRSAGLATQTDEAAKDEIQSALDTSLGMLGSAANPPGRKGALPPVPGTETPPEKAPPAPTKEAPPAPTVPTPEK
jgi:hypothetical protein